MIDATTNKQVFKGKPKKLRVKCYWNNVIVALAADTNLDAVTLKYVLRRTRYEGIGFLTKTLPELSKAVLSGIESGRFYCPKSFKSYRKGAKPAYFAGLLSRIFDPSGRPLRDVDHVSLQNILQFCGYFYKLVLPMGDNQLLSAEREYLETEREMKNLPSRKDWLDKVRKMFFTLYSPIAGCTVQDVFTHSRPRYGPGSFARASMYATPYYLFKQRPDSQVGTTDKRFKAYSGYFKPYASSPTKVNLVGPCDPTCEVLFVPKDSRGPRVISKEPLHLLTAQLSYFSWLKHRIEKYSNGTLNITSQDVNRDLAHKGSLSREWCTLDLSSASDRVSYRHVLHVFRDCPAMRWFFLNARSTHAILPSGTKIELNKLSGMGSGLTFPTMALFIQLAIVTRICEAHPHLPKRYVRDRVFVYGDDIILPTRWYNLAIDGLHASDLLVNYSKSYSNSLYRESCGADFYDGHDVSIVRLRASNSKIDFTGCNQCKHYPFIFQGSEGLLQLERHCRELVKRGMFTLANSYYRSIEAVIGSLPVVSGASPCLGRYHTQPPFEILMDSEHMVLMPNMVAKNDRRSCPYKYLGSYFASSNVCYVVNGMPIERSALPYGVIATPYKVQLQQKLVPTIVLRGQPDLAG